MKTYDHKGKPLMTREEAEAAKDWLWKRHGEKLLALYWHKAQVYLWAQQAYVSTMRPIYIVDV
jgi:hypothetical protein